MEKNPDGVTAQFFLDEYFAAHSMKPPKNTDEFYRTLQTIFDIPAGTTEIPTLEVKAPEEATGDDIIRLSLQEDYMEVLRENPELMRGFQEFLAQNNTPAETSNVMEQDHDAGPYAPPEA